MEGVRRSGRRNDKEPVIWENTIETAIDADLEGSDDEFETTNVYVSKGEKGTKNGKKEKGAVAKRKTIDKDGEENKVVKKPKRKKGESSRGEGSKPYVFQTRSSPKKLFNAVQTLTPVQRACLERIGFGGMLEFKVDGIPNKLGFYVVDNFDPKKMEIKVRNSCILINKDLIGELLGLKNEGKDIMAEEIERDEEMIECWNAQFGNKKEIFTGDIKGMIRKSKVADMNFKLNFIVLFANVMGGVKGKGVCDVGVLDHIRSDTELSCINWCEYVWRGLQTCKDGWKRYNTNSYFLGPLTLLTMAYVDGTVCEGFNVPRVRPATKFWTSELLKERETEENDGEGLGMGELQGPYIEEDVDTMPNDEEGFVWKLSKLIEGIRNVRACFEKTMEAGVGMFPGNLLMSDLNQQYRAALMITQARDEGTRGRNGQAETISKNNEGIEVSNNDPFDLPAFMMGPQTQLEVFRSSDKVCAEYYGDVIRTDMDVPSFSLGFSQDPLFEQERGVEGSGAVNDHQEQELGGKNTDRRKGKEAVSAVPLSVVKPVEGRVKRRVVKSGLMISPFFNRVLEIDGPLNQDEKKVDIYLIKKNGGDQSEIMFEAVFGATTSLQQMYTLVNGENVDDAVINAWSAFLNSLEKYKSSNSYSRLYLPTFVVDVKKFKNDNTAYESVEAFFMYAETLAERAGKKDLVTDVDIAFIPISNGVHKFVVCFNLKYPEVNVFDNSRMRNKDGSTKKVYITNTVDMRIAEILRDNFAKYMRRKKHMNAEAIEKVELRRPQLEWETDNRPNDCGIFAMRHMQHYFGGQITYFKCGFAPEGKKQSTQLNKMRRKYAARLLLAECNIQKDRIIAEMANMQTEIAGVKTRKVPIARN